MATKIRRNIRPTTLPASGFFLADLATTMPSVFVNRSSGYAQRENENLCLAIENNYWLSVVNTLQADKTEFEPQFTCAWNWKYGTSGKSEPFDCSEDFLLPYILVQLLSVEQFRRMEIS